MPKIDVGVLVARVKPEELIRRGKPIINRSVEFFGRRAVSSVGSNVGFNVSNPRTVSFLKRWGADRITGDVNRTTQRRLRTVLSRGVAAGKTHQEIAKDIARVFDVAKGSRSVQIARTEIARASNFASREGYKQAGLEEKEWQATQDATSREDHDAMDGQVVGIDEDFTSPSGYTAPYPGAFGEASEDINCRCGVLPVVSDKAFRNISRLWLYKGLERARAPYDRQMRRAMASGFSAQQAAVMSAFNEMGD
jgi:SPP1 gp7 family putative phage head morphogenesis protein